MKTLEEKIRKKSKTKMHIFYEELLEDINPIKKLWSKVIDKYNTRFYSSDVSSNRDKFSILKPLIF